LLLWREEGDVVSLLFYFVVVYSTFRENIGVVFILDIKTQFFNIKVLGIDDEGLGPCKGKMGSGLV